MRFVTLYRKETGITTIPMEKKWSLQIRKRAMLRKGVRRQRSRVSDTGFLKWQNPPGETLWERGVLPS